MKRFDEPASHGPAYSVAMKLHTFIKRRSFAVTDLSGLKCFFIISSPVPQNEPMSFVGLCHSALSASPCSALPPRIRLSPSIASIESDIRGTPYVLTTLSPRARPLTGQYFKYELTNLVVLHSRRSSERPKLPRNATPASSSFAKDMRL